jgi:hypothetical protein
MRATRVTFTLVDGERHFVVELDDLELAIEERNDLQLGVPSVVEANGMLGADPALMRFALTRPMGGGLARAPIGTVAVSVPTDMLEFTGVICRATAFLDYLAQVLQHFVRQQQGVGS